MPGGTVWVGVRVIVGETVGVNVSVGGANVGVSVGIVVGEGVISTIPISVGDATATGSPSSPPPPKSELPKTTARIIAMSTTPPMIRYSGLIPKIPSLPAAPVVGGGGVVGGAGGGWVAGSAVVC